MVVLADELLEGFFDKALAASFQLERSEVEDYHQTNQKSEGLLGGLMNLVVNDSYVSIVCTLLISATKHASTDSQMALAQH
jgi:hypothetical protein